MNKAIITLVAALSVFALFAGNTCIWTGAKGDGNWATPGNWENNLQPVSGSGDRVILSNAGNSAVISNGLGTISIDGLTIAAGSQAFKLVGDAIQLESKSGNGYGTSYGEVAALYDAAADVEIEIAAPIVLPSGTHYFIIGQAASAHISGVISGVGGFDRRGTVNGSSVSGKLKLSGDNTFEGNVFFRSKETEFASTTAMGVPAQGKTEKTVYLYNSSSVFRFSAEGLYDYNLQVCDLEKTIWFEKDCQFRSLKNTNPNSMLHLRANTAVSVTFNGGFDITDALNANHIMDISFADGGTFHVYGKFAYGLVYVGDRSDVRAYNGGVLHFHGTDVSWRTLRMTQGSIACHVANILPSDWVPNYSWRGMDRVSCVYMYGTDQTIDRLDTSSLAAGNLTDTGRYFQSDTPATLTLKATASASANVSFKDALSVVYDAQGAYRQAITNRTITMTGDLVVSNGTFALVGTTTMKNANAIRVENGGTFELAVSSASALANVRTVSIAAGGTFRMAAATPNPFAGANVINLEDGAKLDLLGDNSLAVPIFTNGVAVADGRYQAADGTDATAVRVGWIKGAGVLSAALGASSWRMATSGDWDAAANWTVAPAADGNVFVAAAGNDYTVTVFADTVPVKEIKVLRPDDGATTLAVGAKLETRYGSATFGRGANVSVTSGGTWETTSVDAYSSASNFLLKDGAIFSVDSGLLHATNFCGILSVGDGKGGATVTNTLRMTAGAMDFRVRNSFDSGMIVNADGRLEVSGGTAQFGMSPGQTSGRPFRHEKGGTVEVSGTGRLEISGSAYFSGLTRFSGNARLSAVKGCTSPTFFVNPVGSGDVATFEFTDHAGVDTTGYSTSGGVEGAYMFNQFQANDGVDGGLTRVLLHGDGLYHFNNVVILGQHCGAAELDQTGGFLRVYSSGIRVGACSASVKSTAPNATAVWRMKGGAAEIRATDEYANYKRVFGLVVGDGTVTNPSCRGRVSGRIELSGGAITNQVFSTITGFGLGDGFGEMVQTGGEFVRKDSGSFLLGFAGGEGRYVMTNGTTKILGSMPIWIGGATTNAINRYLAQCPDSDTAKGLLRVWGGTFTADYSDTCLGARGTGRIEIGPTGALAVRNLVLSNAVSGVEASALRFEFDEAGVGQLQVANKLTVSAGSKLEIDLGHYSGRKSGYNLVTYDSIEGSFDPANISVTGDRELVDVAKVTVGPKAIRVHMSRFGMMMIVR